MRLLTCFAALLLIAACGTKGPLTLPQDHAPKPPAAAPDHSKGKSQ